MSQIRIILRDVGRELPEFLRGLVIRGVVLLALVGAVDLLMGR